jgi:Secretion system C-terminal sorting domain
MKATFTSVWRRLVVLLVIWLTVIDVAEAQLPDCVSGNTIYAIFNRDSTNSTIADSSEIRTVNTVTGAIGGLMGGKRYWIRKQDPSSSTTYYYGSSALGVDMITSRFYLMTQMSPSMGKDIITIDPVTGTMTTIGTTPSTLNSHHFVKLAISPTGVGYAIGVARSTSTGPATFSPLIRFTTCGASPTNNCSNITLLGYLPAGTNMYKNKLFNGDIVFDNYGNLLFLTVAFDSAGSVIKYTNARLFRIEATDIPAGAGTGIIPMSFVADYDNLDSTVVNGIALDGAGDMYLATRRFVNTSSNPSRPWYSELHRSTLPGNSTLIGGFAPLPTNLVIADLASCYFPQTVLSKNKIQLYYKYESKHVNLRWQVSNNKEVAYFQIQRSDNGVDFETIGTVPAANPDQASAAYEYSDPQNGYDRSKFYRVRQIMRNNVGFYSNIVNANFNSKLNLTTNLKPNPFSSQIQATLWLRSANAINVRIVDQSGRTVYTQQFAGKAGDNTLKLERLGNLKPGVYVVEMAVQDDVIREKMIKQ